MNLEELKKKLKSYKRKDIIVTDHADLQALTRQIEVEEVKENIVNPNKLVYFEEQESKNKNEGKYDCYFEYSKTYAHRYILTVNGKLIIVTIIRINRDWQKIVERK